MHRLNLSKTRRFFRVVFSVALVAGCIMPILLGAVERWDAAVILGLAPLLLLARLVHVRNPCTPWILLAMAIPVVVIVTQELLAGSARQARDMAPWVVSFGAVFALLLWSVRQDAVIGWRLRITAFCLGGFVPFVLPLGFAGTYIHPELQLDSYFSLAACAASVFTLAGVVGVLRGRTWGVCMFPVAALLPVLWVPEASWFAGRFASLGHPLVAFRALPLLWMWVAAHLTVFLLWTGPIVRFLRSEGGATNRAA